MDSRTELVIRQWNLLPTWERLDRAALCERISDLDSTDPLTFVFVHDEVEVPCRLSILPGADRLLVLFNGAVDRARSSSGIVFQRGSWRDDLPAHCLWVADPTLAQSPQLSIGWGQLNATDFLPFIVKHLVGVTAHVLGNLSSQHRLYFGSSAGGFQALACASLDQGGTALVNNPQTNWLLYPVKRAVDLVVSRVLGRSTTEQVLDGLAWRSDLRCFFELMGHAPRVEYFVNFGSRFDLDDHYRPLREWYEAQNTAIAGVSLEL